MKLFDKLNIKATVIGVLLFIAVLVAALLSEQSHAGPYIGIGKAAFNSHMTTGEAGYRFENNWDVQALLIGQGQTSNGYQAATGALSVSHVIWPGWYALGGDYFMRLGAAYVKDSRLVGPIDYRLGVGLNYDVVELEVGHYSSGGIFETNTGIDIAATLRVLF